MEPEEMLRRLRELHDALAMLTDEDSRAEAEALDEAIDLLFTHVWCGDSHGTDCGEGCPEPHYPDEPARPEGS